MLLLCLMKITQCSISQEVNTNRGNTINLILFWYKVRFFFIIFLRYNIKYSFHLIFAQFRKKDEDKTFSFTYILNKGFNCDWQNWSNKIQKHVKPIVNI